MSARSMIALFAALLFAAGTVFAVRYWLAGQQAQVARAQPVAIKIAPPDAWVLVAERTLPAGRLLTAADLRWQAWPDGDVPASYFVQSEDQDAPLQPGLTGAVVRRGISAGEPLTRGRIVKPGERGFLAAVLRSGYRATAIPVDAAAGIAGLVFPGDRIDVILSHTVLEPGDERTIERRVSETVLTNVRVLALDQNVDDQAADPKVAKTATLEVTPKQAEILTVARALGRLSLSLRSLARNEAELRRLADGGKPLAEPDPAQGRTFTLDTQVSRLVPPRRRRHAGNTVVVARGGAAETLEFTP